MLEDKIKEYTEQLYHETFSTQEIINDKFDWDDIASLVNATAHQFAEWKEEQLTSRLSDSVIKHIVDVAQGDGDMDFKVFDIKDYLFHAITGHWKDWGEYD